MEADGLFVHANLREGGSGHAWLLRTHPEGMTTAYVPGRLFHLPEEQSAALVLTDEPAFGPPGSGWVTGAFVGYDDPESLEAALADLDALEGVEEERTIRQQTLVVLASGHRYQAWVYAFPADRIPRLERFGVELPEGDWGAYL